MTARVYFLRHSLLKGVKNALLFDSQKLFIAMSIFGDFWKYRCEIKDKMHLIKLQLCLSISFFEPIPRLYTFMYYKTTPYALIHFGIWAFFALVFVWCGTWVFPKKGDTLAGDSICRRFTSRKQIAKKWDFVMNRGNRQRHERTNPLQLVF